MIHKPVLIKEVIEYLDPKPGQNFVDGTVGQGGHARLILEKIGPKGKLLGIDWDSQQAENSRQGLQEFRERLVLICDSYANIASITRERLFAPVHGILVDLGYSSWHLEDSKKGFAFLKDEPLDMRYHDKGELTAERILNEYSEKELINILEEYGEEKFARQIGKNIINHRNKKRIVSTFELVKIIEESVPRKFWQHNIHVATRTFQALRIAVNQELENLQHFLPQAINVLAPGGRLVIISFHSLEDRMVKQFFANYQKEGKVDILTKKPVMASDQEVRENPRSRSAKLRAIVKN